jgi:hypothetical protein
MLYLAVILYLFVPVLLIAFGKVRAIILSPVHETEWVDQPGWKRPAFTGIILASAILAWPLFILDWFAERERGHAAIMNRRECPLDIASRTNKIRTESDPTPAQNDRSLGGGISITKTGLVSTLGAYANAGELFLTNQITGTEAKRIRDQMHLWSRFVTSYPGIRFESPEKLDPPLWFEPLETDEVWEFTTKGNTWKYLSGRSGYALVRDGVLICETVTMMS